MHHHLVARLCHARDDWHHTRSTQLGKAWQRRHGGCGFTVERHKDGLAGAKVHVWQQIQQRVLTQGADDGLDAVFTAEQSHVAESLTALRDPRIHSRIGLRREDGCEVQWQVQGKRGPPHIQTQIRTQLSGVLKGIITQQLVKKADGSGRTAAFEILAGTDGVLNLIRENKAHQITTALQTGAKDGMCTLEQSLAKLVNEGIITSDEAKSKSSDKKQLLEYINNIH